jgi:hypothetical protein
MLDSIEMAPSINSVSSEGSTKYGDLEEELGFVMVTLAGEATEEGVRANDPSLNQSNDDATVLVSVLTILACLLLTPWFIVHGRLNPVQRVPNLDPDATANLVVMCMASLAMCAACVVRAGQQGRPNDSTARDKMT